MEEIERVIKLLRDTNALPEEYIEIFSEQHISHSLFITFNEDDLKEIGIKTFGARKTILGLIRDQRALFGMDTSTYPVAFRPPPSQEYVITGAVIGAVGNGVSGTINDFSTSSPPSQPSTQHTRGAVGPGSSGTINRFDFPGDGPVFLGPVVGAPVFASGKKSVGQHINMHGIALSDMFPTTYIGDARHVVSDTYSVGKISGDREKLQKAAGGGISGGYYALGPGAVGRQEVHMHSGQSSPASPVPPVPPTSPSTSAILVRMPPMMEEADAPKDADRGLCVICTAKYSTHALVHTSEGPKHQCVCSGCAHKLFAGKNVSDTSCPICRSPVKEVIHIIIS